MPYQPRLEHASGGLALIVFPLITHHAAASPPGRPPVAGDMTIKRRSRVILYSLPADAALSVSCIRINLHDAGGEILFAHRGALRDDRACCTGAISATRVKAVLTEVITLNRLNTIWRPSGERLPQDRAPLRGVVSAHDVAPHRPACGAAFFPARRSREILTAIGRRLIIITTAAIARRGRAMLWRMPRLAKIGCLAIN